MKRSPQNSFCYVSTKGKTFTLLFTLEEKCFRFRVFKGKQYLQIKFTRKVYIRDRKYMQKVWIRKFCTTWLTKNYSTYISQYLTK